MGVFSRLGSVQYDPLKPLGSNHDLVLQARVPDYQVDDWQTLAYQDRFIYDGWDKQASLVMTKDWPLRRIYHHWHKQYWQKRVLQAYPKAIKIVLQEIKTRGPLSSTELNYQAHVKDWEETWYGPKIGKNVLRALWHTGVLATHHRDKGRHVYDLAENDRIIIQYNYAGSDLSYSKNNATVTGLNFALEEPGGWDYTTDKCSYMIFSS